MHRFRLRGFTIGFALFSIGLGGCSTLSAFGPHNAVSAPLGTSGAPAVGRTEARVAPDAASYAVVPLGTLGGSIAAGISINDQGVVAGYSTLAGDQVVNAAIWRGRTAIGLGTLGGPNSAVEWPNHDEREVVGISQTSMTDPLGEHWSCSAFIPYTGNTCLGFVWRNNAMTPLPTLGGNNGYASGANAAGQVVGWAETSMHDSTCHLPQVLQFEAVVWGPNGAVQQLLAPYRHDPDSAATAINDEGDVVGISGICQNAVGELSAKHAILWQGGSPMSIGTLGGAGWNTPTSINQAGAVTGFSDLPGDDNGKKPNFHAFSWTRSAGIRDLGTLSGDHASLAYAINDDGQIVGQSCTDASCSSSRAFIYENGSMRDLNSLECSGSIFMVFANDINDQGEITGLGVDANGNVVGFRAIPTASQQGTVGVVRPRRFAIPMRLRGLISRYGVL